MPIARQHDLPIDFAQRGGADQLRWGQRMAREESDRSGSPVTKLQRVRGNRFARIVRTRQFDRYATLLSLRHSSQFSVDKRFDVVCRCQGRQLDDDFRACGAEIDRLRS